MDDPDKGYNILSVSFKNEKNINELIIDHYNNIMYKTILLITLVLIILCNIN